MSVPTKFKFKDYERAVFKIAKGKGLLVHKINHSGSGRRYEVYKYTGENPVLVGFWVNHEDKYVWLRDMRKCLPHLGITEEDLINSCFYFLTSSFFFGGDSFRSEPTFLAV